MEEISPTHFDRVMPLFKHIPHQRPAVFAVLEGTQTGRVFVDNIRDPSAAVILSAFNTYIGGSSGNPDLMTDVANVLLSEVISKKEHVLLCPLTEAWRTALQKIFQPYQPKIYERTRFDFDPQRYAELHNGWRQRIPAGFSLQRINTETALEVGGIPELWGTVENFLTYGFGFCMLDETLPGERKAFAASAQTVFMGDGWAETGVETREAYRRKGLATAVSCAYIDHCLQTGIYPEWTCINNEASEQLAYKMGYINKQNYPFIYIHSAESARGK